MTLYLKYRPQTIAELDLASVREMLEKVLASGKLPHAWLLSGPRGTGKTSSARIIAKAINCLTPSGHEPCNECGMCTAITGGSAPDVIEIDAASNRGIEEIRDLRDKVRLAPMQAKFKVYIIDEVHMLTTEAANALLKTLEEPPEHTVFMLCTTDPERLPDTVVSRCTRIVFKKPNLVEAVSSLERVAKGEGVKTNKKALELIVASAKGSFRDGTKILEQILTTKNDLSEDNVREIVGLQAENDPEEFLKLWEEKDTEKALVFINRMAEEGVNLRSWVERVVEVLREMLLSSTKSEILSSRQILISKIRKLEKAYEEMKTSTVTQLPLEIMIIEDGDINNQDPNSKIQTISSLKKNDTPIEKKNIEVKETKLDVVIEKKAEATGKGKYGLDDLMAKWNDILKAVKPKNHSVEGLLRSTKAIDFDGERMTLEVFYKFHKDKLETDKCRKIVEEAVNSVFGVSGAKLFLKLGEKSVQKENISGHVGEDILKAAADIFKAEVV